MSLFGRKKSSDLLDHTSDTGLMFSLLITTNIRSKWTHVAPQCHTFTISRHILIPDNSLSFQLFQDSFPAHVLSFSPTKRGGIRGTLFLLHLLILKYKMVSMRNRTECVSLTFFVECIRTSCSSNLKRSAAHLIESSPWRLLSGAQVSSKKPSVCMNAANDHMSEGVDPQADSCDPPHEKESQQILQIMVHKRWECCAHQRGSLEVINWSGPKLKPLL